MTASAPAARIGSWAAARTRIALALVLLYAATSTAHWLQRAARWPAHPGRDEISAYEGRFATLRTMLPSRGRVGYVGSPAVPAGSGREANASALLHFRRYLLAQYSLAPVLLVESTEPDLVVGNFEPGATASAPAGFETVRAFGDGVVLFRRTGR